MTKQQHLDEKAAQVARLEVRLKVLTMEIVTIMRFASASNASGAEANALFTYLQLEQAVEEFGVRPLLQLSELPLGTISQRILDDVEAILKDPNRMEAGKLAAAARLLLGDQPHVAPTRTVH